MGARPIRATFAAALPSLAAPAPAVPAYAVLTAAVLAAALLAGCGAPAGRGGGSGRAGSGQHGSGQHGSGQHGSGQHSSGQNGAAGRTSRRTAATVLPFPAAENRKTGTRHWRITHLGPPDAIEGFAGRVSVLPGQSFRLYVSTTAASFHVQAFRMGWYGGARARQVWASGRVAGRVQRPARISPATRMVRAPWRPSMTVSTAGWPPGAYLLRLDAAGGAQRYVPVTVRSPSTAGTVVLVLGVTTWQAYNLWGGYDLYDGPQGFGDRSYRVTFDRPYGGDGAMTFLAFDEAPIALAERTAGVPLSYETDTDLAAHPGLLRGARAVITLGHDEYYSASMRRALLDARDAGTNLAFLGANAMYRHIRLAPSPLGPGRMLICYKVASLDPMHGKDHAATTQNWRDPPDPRPESVITGVFYECNPVSARYVVLDPKSWILAGTHVHKGTSFPGLVGPEYDRVNPAVPFPRRLEVLAHSPLVCDGVHSYSDSAYYTVASGAGVFAAGTMRWVCAMRVPHCGHRVGRAAGAFVDRVTQNLLRAFAAGPAGRAHPARSNLAAVRPARGSPYEGT